VPGVNDSTTGTYPPIEDHGAIGDLHTVALVAADGTIDWCCLPRFDSPAVFASILDSRRGGRFALRVEGAETRRPMYHPDTNIHVTRSLSRCGAGEVVDFMVPRPSLRASEPGSHVIVRRARAVRGSVTFDMRCEPAFDFGRADHDVELVPDVGAAFRSSAGSMTLRSTAALVVAARGVSTRFRLREGEAADFILAWDGVR
jgi:GH15 family glucan-1,4-alpha-glucosidase